MNKVNGDQMNADDLDTLVEGIRYAIEHGGNVSVVTTPLVGGGGYKITITDSEGIAHDVEVRDGGDAYEVYKSTVPEGQTPMSKDAWLASLKGADGADGQDGAPGHNPNLGTFLDTDTNKPTMGQAGDYFIVIDTTAQTRTASVWAWDGTSFADTGKSVEDFGLQFASGQALPDVKIKDENGNEVTGPADVLSAEAGVEINSQINGYSVPTVIDVVDTFTSTAGDEGYYLENVSIKDNGATAGSTGLRTYIVFVEPGDIINASGLFAYQPPQATNKCYYALYSSHSIGTESFISCDKVNSSITNLEIQQGTLMIALCCKVEDINDVNITLTKFSHQDGLEQRVQRLEYGGDEYIQERTEEKTVTVNYEWLVANSTRYDGSIISGGTSINSAYTNYKCMAWYADSDGTIYVDTVGTSTTLFRVLVATGEPTSYVQKQFGGYANHPLPDSSSPFTFGKGDLIIVNYTDNKTDFQLTMHTTETAPWLDESVKIPYLEELKEEGGGIATKADLADLGANYFELFKTSATEFTLTLNLNGGKKVKHRFQHVTITKDYGTQEVPDVRTTCDVWHSLSTSLNNVLCIQGNLNFIYMMNWQYDNIPKTAEDAFKVNAGDSIIISVPAPPITQYTDFVIKHNSTNITTSWLENNATKYVGKADRNGYNSADTGYNTYIFTAPDDGDIYVPTKGYTNQVDGGITKCLMHLLVGTGGISDYQLNYWGEIPWPNERAHIGPDHGCEIRDYSYFYCDGNLVDIESMNVNDKVTCKKFRFVERTKCYAGIKEDKSQPILVDGEFILAHVHYLDAEFTNDGRIRWDNKLTVKRDYTSYMQAYGGMLRVYYPYIEEISINNNEDTTNFVSNDGTFTLAHNSTINLRTKNSQWGDTIIVRGHVGENDGFVVKQTMVQADNARRGHSNCYFQYYDDSHKVYLMPVVGGQDGRANALNTPFDVFNDGDVIEVFCEREIIY